MCWVVGTCQSRGAETHFLWLTAATRRDSEKPLVKRQGAEEEELSHKWELGLEIVKDPTLAWIVEQIGVRVRGEDVSMESIGSRVQLPALC